MSAIVERRRRGVAEAQDPEAWAWGDYLAETAGKIGELYESYERAAWATLQRRLRTIARTRGAA